MCGRSFVLSFQMCWVGVALGFYTRGNGMCPLLKGLPDLGTNSLEGFGKSCDNRVYHKQYGVWSISVLMLQSMNCKWYSSRVV